MTAEEAELAELEMKVAVREDAQLWFEVFGYFLDDEKDREPRNGPALVLQRRYFEHYKRCRETGEPCLIQGLKYRRASSSTGANAILYHHTQNVPGVRGGVIGKDYKSATNMLAMVKTFGRYDKFTGWYGSAMREEVEQVQWDDKVKKDIATKLVWSNDSMVELYTAENPFAASSAGLQCYVATEVGKWPKQGQKDGRRTMMAVRATLPKHGFCIAIEESTAEGADGIFYDSCLAAKWPEYATWWKKWETDFVLTPEKTEAERRRQFVLIFAGWFEDERNFYRLSAADEEAIRSSIDSEAWYEGEQELIDRYGEDGPRGKRLGSEVNATVWEQLAWRRVQIKAVGGLDAFKQEYPASPSEAFRSTGAPVFDQDALMAIELGQRGAEVSLGALVAQPSAPRHPVWHRTREAEAVFSVWEAPRVGLKYILAVDPASGKELVKGQRERDCHAVLVIRGGYRDGQNRYWPARVVARIRPPCRWEIAPLARQVALLARYYGNCMIVVENNIGTPLMTRLRSEYSCNLYRMQRFDHATQAFTEILGYLTDPESRRMLVAEAQEYVRERAIDIPCPHVLGEMRSFVKNSDGRAEAASGRHDDDVICLGMGLVCLPSATVYHEAPAVTVGPIDADHWKESA